MGSAAHAGPPDMALEECCTRAEAGPVPYSRLSAAFRIPNSCEMQAGRPSANNRQRPAESRASRHADVPHARRCAPSPQNRSPGGAGSPGDGVWDADR
ncbi:hypothetical protein T484DRAFT_1925475 [Baffinella frigidus]|nr:hypothetical protein T484DRAFT_1925475 [Cryptophyta sp. CCMP2293]